MSIGTVLIIRATLSPRYLFQVMQSKGFTAEESNDSGLVKQVQCITGCKEICELLSKLCYFKQEHKSPYILPASKNTSPLVPPQLTASLSDNSTDSPDKCQIKRKHMHHQEPPL